MEKEAGEGLRRRSGSETRQKQRRVTFRLTEAEHTELETAALSRGETLGTYIRSQLLAKPITGSRRRPIVEVQAVTRLQGEMNKVGSNIYQLLRRINFGETPEVVEIREAFSGYKEVIGAIMATLNRVPK